MGVTAGVVVLRGARVCKMPMMNAYAAMIPKANTVILAKNKMNALITPSTGFGRPFRCGAIRFGFVPGE